MKAFILDWHEKGFAGVSDEVAKYLTQLKLRGNSKGKAVSKGCPHTGAYNMQEQQAILEWAVNAFVDQKLSLEEYCWLMSNMYLGSRSIELRNITRGDLISLKSTENIETYKLKKVLAKKRNASFREISEKIEIDEDLALLLLNQANSSIKYIEQHFKENLSNIIKNKIPVFIEKSSVSELNTLSQLNSMYLESTTGVTSTIMGREQLKETLKNYLITTIESLLKDHQLREVDLRFLDMENLFQIL